MNARQIIEAESPKRFLRNAPRPLRKGKGWHLIIQTADGNRYDDIPVEMSPGNFPETLDAPYNLAADVQNTIISLGLDPGEVMTPDDPNGDMRIELEMEKYWKPIYVGIAAGRTTGLTGGVAGVRHWYLQDYGEEIE